ncbi:MAG: hypothetical protein ACPK85_03535 [Methanosarcina sp.]
MAHHAALETIFCSVCKFVKNSFKPSYVPLMTNMVNVFPCIDSSAGDAIQSSSNTQIGLTD